MKVFVTGVGGQLGHDVMNELSGRGYEGVGSDIKPEYSGVYRLTELAEPSGYAPNNCDKKPARRPITHVIHTIIDS